MNRIVILGAGQLLAEQIAQEMAKHGHAVELADLKALDPVAVPSFNLAPGLRQSARHAPAGRSCKGKRVAQWKQERTDR